MPLPISNTKPAKNWLPNLNGLKLPGQLTNAVQQHFLLTYSLRDTTSALQQAQERTIQYGLHITRVQTAAASVPDGALYYETDRAGVVYQARMVASTEQWVVAGGIMWSTSGVQPTDLGGQDAGFVYAAAGPSFSQWNGTAWVSL
jgi:hypothetical protein